MQQLNHTFANKIVTFIQTVKSFESSILSKDDPILQIYKEYQIYIGNKPSLTQVFLNSVRIFAQTPFSLTKEIFQIIFINIFSPIFSPRSCDIILNFEGPKVSAKQNSEFRQKQREKIRQKFSPSSYASKHAQMMNLNLQILQLIQNSLNQFQLPTILEWYKLCLRQIKKQIIFIEPITEQEMQALITEIKNIKCIQTLGFMLNVKFYIQAVSHAFSDRKFMHRFMLQAAFKHEIFEPNHCQEVMDSRLWYFLRQRFRSKFAEHYSESKYVNIKKLFRLVILDFFAVVKPFQSYVPSAQIHTLHVFADKSKKNLFADMLKSKCFRCNAQRFASSSIQKMRLYQCLSKKLHNALDPGKTSFHMFSSQQIGTEDQRYQSLSAIQQQDEVFQ